MDEQTHKKIPNAHDLRRLAVVALTSDRTARRWYQGARLQINSRLRLELAAEALGMAKPECGNR